MSEKLTLSRLQIGVAAVAVILIAGGAGFGLAHLGKPSMVTAMADAGKGKVDRSNQTSFVSGSRSPR